MDSLTVPEYGQVKIPRPLYERAQKAIREHQEHGLTSVAELVKGLLNTELDYWDGKEHQDLHHSQPAPIPRPSQPPSVAQNSSVARNARGGQHDEVLDEAVIRKQYKARVDGQLPPKTRKHGIAIVQGLAKFQGFDLNASDLEKLYERIVQEGKL